MKNWWNIARLEIRLALADKQAVFWGLLWPLALTAFIGYTFNAERKPGPIRAAYRNGDNPQFVDTMFRTLLSRDGIVVDTGDDLPEICVPDSLIQKLAAGEGAAVTIRVDEESRSSRTIAVKTQKILVELLFQARREWLDDPPGEAEIAASLQERGPLILNRASLGAIPHTPSGTERTLPAMLVMFLLFSLFTFFTPQWIEDLHTGKIRRIVVSPTTMGDLLAGHICSRMLWGILQIVFVGAIGTLIFKIRWDLPLVSASVLLLSYMFAVTSLGMLFGSLFDNLEKAHVLGVIASLVLAALGGCWWPLEIVPAPMKVAALFTPTGLAMDAFGSFLAEGSRAPFPAFNVACLTLAGAIIMPLALHRMKKQIIR